MWRQVLRQYCFCPWGRPRRSGLVAQALRDVGKDNVTDDHLARVRTHLPASARKQLLQDLPQVPAWMRPHFRQIARTDD